MSKSIIHLEYFSPTGIIGFWILFFGIIFTSIMIYFVFFKLGYDEYSYKDRKRKEREEQKQKERIARLYPKEY